MSWRSSLYHPAAARERARGARPRDHPISRSPVRYQEDHPLLSGGSSPVRLGRLRWPAPLRTARRLRRRQRQEPARSRPRCATLLTGLAVIGRPAGRDRRHPHRCGVNRWRTVSSHRRSSWAAYLASPFSCRLGVEDLGSRRRRPACFTCLPHVLLLVRMSGLHVDPDVRFASPSSACSRSDSCSRVE